MFDLITIDTITFTAYFFSAFTISYVAPKAEIGKIFWYGISVFFASFFIYILILFSRMEITVFLHYSTFLLALLSLLPAVGAVIDKRLWAGELSPAERYNKKMEEL